MCAQFTVMWMGASFPLQLRRNGFCDWQADGTVCFGFRCRLRHRKSDGRADVAGLLRLSAGLPSLCHHCMPTVLRGVGSAEDSMGNNIGPGGLLSGSLFALSLYPRVRSLRLRLFAYAGDLGAVWARLRSELSRLPTALRRWASSYTDGRARKPQKCLC